MTIFAKGVRVTDSLFTFDRQITYKDRIIPHGYAQRTPRIPVRGVYYICDMYLIVAMIRSSFFIDGFNLYHAIKRLNEPHLKWVDLMRLMHRQISPKTEMVQAVYYFSAFAHWLPDQKSRHEQYVAALDASGVHVVLGQFKDKHKYCHDCGATWIQHEEKETDVNVALYVLNEAYRDTYDRAYIVSRDSDLKPAVEMVKMQFPKKQIYIVAPPHLGHSNDLIQVADGKQKIKKQQIEESLFPSSVQDGIGNIVASRPPEYDPPIGPAAP